MNVTPPDVPTPGMAGGEKAKACASEARRAAVQVAHDDVGGEPLRVALVPLLQRDEVERVVGRGRELSRLKPATPV